MARPEQNFVLAGLPVHARARLFPRLEPMLLPAGRCLHEPGEPMRYVYFPADCFVSLIQVMGTGITAEIAQVGREGVVDAPVCLGAQEATNRAVVQSAGSIYRLPIALFGAEFNRQGELFTRVLRYTQFFAGQVSQMALCYRHHRVKEQLCRWLLCATDRMDVPELFVTQEQISTLLGVRREGITEAAGQLQKLGLIEYGRGRVKITDRQRLEGVACQCYGMIKRELESL